MSAFCMQDIVSAVKKVAGDISEGLKKMEE